MVGSAKPPGTMLRSLDDLGDDFRRNRLDMGRIRQLGSVMIVAGLELTRTWKGPLSFSV
jgi:hypothetical protein